MKTYMANVKVTAILFDGTKKSIEEAKEFCTSKKGISHVSTDISNNKLYILVRSRYGEAWIVFNKDYYIVRYPSGLYYPYKKAAFEKRFKIIE